MVVEAHTVPHPRAMMIHSEDADAAYFAVMGSGLLYFLTLEAKASSP